MCSACPAVPGESRTAIRGGGGAERDVCLRQVMYTGANDVCLRQVIRNTSFHFAAEPQNITASIASNFTCAERRKHHLFGCSPVEAAGSSPSISPCRLRFFLFIFITYASLPYLFVASERRFFIYKKFTNNIFS